LRGLPDHQERPEGFGVDEADLIRCWCSGFDPVSSLRTH
jgi:hypothetical protein